MIDGSKLSSGGTNLITPEAEEGAVNLVGSTKHHVVVGSKIFMRAMWRMVP
ncbi:hypothetical protein A2U01_0113678, partial [Trifolium medium]|nr:hypothetical protein [Trifolium medium]